MPSTEVRRMSVNVLDGLKFNKDKLATTAIALCDLHDRLQAAHTVLKTKAAEMEAELTRLKQYPLNSSKTPEMPPEFAGIFDDFFGKPKGGAR
jgi:hypothetical protein